MITHLYKSGKKVPDALPATTLPIYPGLGPASRDTEMCHRWLLIDGAKECRHIVSTRN